MSQPQGQAAFTGLPSMNQFRTTRRIVGDQALSFAFDGQRCNTSIGACGDWRRTGVTLEIPYGALTSPDADTCWPPGASSPAPTARPGKCARHPVAAQTGEAAGIAAALWRNNVHSVSPDAVAEHMHRAGHVIHL